MQKRTSLYNKGGMLKIGIINYSEMVFDLIHVYSYPFNKNVSMYTCHPVDIVLLLWGKDILTLIKPVFTSNPFQVTNVDNQRTT